jgi:hypothetical protein
MSLARFKRLLVDGARTALLLLCPPHARVAGTCDGTRSIGIGVQTSIPLLERRQTASAGENLPLVTGQSRLDLTGHCVSVAGMQLSQNEPCDPQAGRL